MGHTFVETSRSSFKPVWGVEEFYPQDITATSLSLMSSSVKDLNIELQPLILRKNNKNYCLVRMMKELMNVQESDATEDKLKY
jgi:hypothetical protein